MPRKSSPRADLIAALQGTLGGLLVLVVFAVTGIGLLLAAFLLSTGFSPPAVVGALGPATATETPSLFDPTASAIVDIDTGVTDPAPARTAIAIQITDLAASQTATPAGGASPGDEVTPATPLPNDLPGRNGIVAADGVGLNLRAEPSATALLLIWLPEGTPLRIVARNAASDWLLIESRLGNGWVFGRWVQHALDLNTLPIAGPAPTATPAPGVTPAPSPTPQPISTLTAAGDYEHLYNINGRAGAIYLAGQQRGNRPNTFSKVGDSITAGAASQFLAQFGMGQYDLGQHTYLQPVVDFFSQVPARENNLSFNNTSLAADNGWSTRDLLDPAKADATLCLEDETPLACEYRWVRPSVALIMIGTNDSGGMAVDLYRTRLTTIVEYSIQMGVIPVLFTIPPKNYNPATDGRVDEFNRIIVEIANTYEIPLIDYHPVMMTLPNLGLRSDGVHPSEPPGYLNAHLTPENLQYGAPVRNLLALQMLDSLWRSIIRSN